MKKTLSQFIKDSQDLHGDLFDYSESVYVGAHVKLLIKCKKHGSFLIPPTRHLKKNGKGGCKFCQSEKTSKRCRKSKSQFIKDAKKVHGDRYDYSLVDYKTAKDKVKIICKIHGLFKTTPDTHINKKRSCPSCGEKIKKQKSDKRALTQEEFISKARRVHGNKYNYDLTLYEKFHKRIKIKCKKHGVFKQSPSSHLSGCGCPFCKSSKGEIRIEKYLKSKQIKYIKEAKFDNCKNKRCLPFDFYLPDHCLLIEYDGEQHFKPVATFGGKKTFTENKKRSKIKNKFSTREGINLLRIPYFKFDNIEPMIDKMIETLKNVSPLPNPYLPPKNA